MGPGSVLCLRALVLIDEHRLSSVTLPLPHCWKVGKVRCLQPALLCLLLPASLFALPLSRVSAELGPGQPTRPLCQLCRLSSGTQEESKQLGVPPFSVTCRPQAVQEKPHPL